MLDAAIEKLSLLADETPVADESGIDAELWEHMAPEIQVRRQTCHVTARVIGRTKTYWEVTVEGIAGSEVAMNRAEVEPRVRAVDQWRDRSESRRLRPTSDLPASVRGTWDHRGLPGRDEQIENYIRTIRNMAKIGVLGSVRNPRIEVVGVWGKPPSKFP